MGKKKKKTTTIESKPWCYYCDKDFEDTNQLLQHQKAKHFRCKHCGKRFSNVPGMSVHITHVHNTTLESVPNAIPGRDAVTLDIVGMNGIPLDDDAMMKRSGNENASANKPEDTAPANIPTNYSMQQQYQQQQTQNIMPAYQAPIDIYQQSHLGINYRPPPTHTQPPPGMPHPSYIEQYIAMQIMTAQQQQQAATLVASVGTTTPTTSEGNSAIPAPNAQAVSTEALPTTKAETGVDMSMYDLEGLIFKYRKISPEEIRVLLPKYAYDEKAAQEHRMQIGEAIAEHF